MRTTSLRQWQDGLLRFFGVAAGLFPLAALWFSSGKDPVLSLLLSPVALMVGLAFWMIVEDSRQ